MIGKRFSLRWKYRHRVEVMLMALEDDYILGDADHRCGFSCEMPLGGPQRYRYADFPVLFQPMAEDAIALPGAQ